ncbi:DUF5702 domain-containing protein [Fusibacter sp. 3D3]|uniref:DUF5702 domain-containing protein n=1 Tax=Fusibacter sp. 3D3 TaxID=1048380 RepID=UPI000853DF2B|nr:DUF5702 domain-containing protein [Fusibacter sp. 3D3]GAU78032.1 hypothetical protein F3D3_2661 [Fusibacter sp. 3D3]
MIKKEYKGAEGNITLFLVIVIPLFLISIFLVYDLIDVKQSESKALKVAIACSEARLSKYNTFLFERYGILAYKEDDPLEGMISAYYIGNHLKAAEDSDMEIKVTSMSLNDPINYLNAIRSAAPYVITEALIDEVMQFLEQNETILKAQKLINDKMDRYQDLSKKFERSEVHEALGNLVKTKDSVDLHQALQTYRNYIDYGASEFYKSCTENQIIDREIELEPDAVRHYYEKVWDTSQVNTLKNAYDAQTNQLYTGYIKFSKHEASLKVNALNIENIDLQMDSYKDAISRLYSIRPAPVEAIQNLQSQIIQLEFSKKAFQNEIEKVKNEIKTTSDLMLKELGKQDDGLLDKLRGIQSKLGSLTTTGISVEDKSLELETDYEYDSNDACTQNQAFKEAIRTVTLPEKIMINEYLMSISKTLVENEVRSFDPLNVKETRHYKIEGEIEYLIGHSQSDIDNFNEVKTEILAMRTGLNLLGIVMDSKKRNGILEIVTPIPFPWNAVTYAAILATWSGVEGYYDLTLLERGKGTHFIKAEDEWLMSLETLIDSRDLLEDMDSAKNQNLKQAPLTSNSNSDLVNHLDQKLYYRDYLRIMINVQGLDRTLLRHMALVEAQIQKDSKDEAKLEDFKVGHEVAIKGHFPYIFRSALSSFSLNFSNAYDMHFKR